MKTWVVYLSIIAASGLFMITLYNSLVDARSWGADMPSSIQVVRQYYLHVDPRNFFQFIAPVNQVLIMLAVILFWKDGTIYRFCFGAAFLLYGVIFFLTIYYFVPRDIILFNTSNNQHSWQEVAVALQEWKAMNWIRSVIGLAGIAVTCFGLHKYYRSRF